MTVIDISAHVSQTFQSRLQGSFLYDWDSESVLRSKKMSRGNLADESAATAAIEAASIKKLTFKADSLQKVVYFTSLQGFVQILIHQTLSDQLIEASFLENSIASLVLSNKA